MSEVEEFQTGEKLHAETVWIVFSRKPSTMYHYDELNVFFNAVYFCQMSALEFSEGKGNTLVGFILYF